MLYKNNKLIEADLKMLKNQYIIKYIVAIFLCTFMTVAQAENQLIKDMVHFDQAYIPVLAMTSAGNVKASQASFAALENVWREFKNKYYSKSGKDDMWQSDFDKLDGYIQASKKIILSGSNIKNAHVSLEHVKVVLMHLRERNGIEYYIDKLTRFHEPMEKIVLAVKGKTGVLLTDNAVTLVKNTLPEAVQLWQQVSASKFDSALYEFNAAKVEKLGTLVKKEQAALKRLQKAVKANNKVRIIQAGLAIKPNFARLFEAFGHFPTPNQKAD